MDYSLTVAARTALVLEMRSREIDSVLELAGAGVALSDDDSGGGYDAKIETVLEPGRYTVSAGSYGADGAFVLAARRTELPADVGGGPLGVDAPLDRRLLPGAATAASSRSRTPANTSST